MKQSAEKPLPYGTSEREAYCLEQPASAPSTQIGKIGRWVRRNIMPIVVASSVAAHFVVPAAVRSIQNAFFRQKEEQTDDDETRLLKMSFQERTDARKVNLKEQKEAYTAFAEQIRTLGTEDQSYQEITSQEEFYGEGIEGQIIAKGKLTLDLLVKRLEQGKPQIPDAKFLQTVKTTFHTPEYGNETASSAFEALAIKGLPDPDAGKGVQNCYSVTKQLAMAMDKLYPDNKQAIQIQEFAGHIRLLYQIGTEKFIMDINEDVQPFPDEESRSKRSRIMSYESYLKLKFGEPEANLEDITYYGPEETSPPTSKHPTTDQLSTTSKPAEPLGTYSSPNPIPTTADARANRAKLKKLEEVQRPTEVELFSTVLTAEEAKKIVANTSVSSLGIDLQTKLENPSAAKELSLFKGSALSLYNLTELDPQSAEELGKFKGNELQVFGLKAIDPQSAKGLSEFQGTILFIESGKLSRESAREFARSKSQILNISSMTSLEPDAAKELSRYKGLFLEMSFTGSLHPSSAGELAKFMGMLSVNIPSLDRETAKELAKYTGDRLVISNFMTLDPETAGELSQYSGDELRLLLKDFTSDAHTSINQQTATELSKSKAKNLFLAVSQLSGITAGELRQFRGDRLIIFVDELDIPSAREFSNFRGRNLTMYSRLNADTAKELIKYNGSVLEISSYDLQDPETATVLSQAAIETLSISGFELEPKIARELAKSKAKYLQIGVRTLNPETARELAKFKGEILTFDQLETIDEPTRKELRYTECAIYYPSIKRTEVPNLR